MKSIFFSLIFLCSFSLLFAQSYQLSNQIPIQDIQGQQLSNSWAGGMAMPQFSQMDLDGDEFMDLVTFDREDGTFTPYLNIGKVGESNFVYAPEYKSIFDNCNCFGWASIIDYDCDGKEDVFCGTRTANVLLYEQTTFGASKTFELIGDRLRSLYSSGFSPLFSGKLDYPAVIDVDYDGDIDFLTWANGFDFIELHRNKAQELYGRCDTLIFELERCWGHFREIGFDNDFILEDTVSCPLGDYNPNERQEVVNSRHAAGSSTLLLDLNADSVYDALIGDADFSGISALYNGGNINYAYMDSVEFGFPSYDNPIDIDIFPACFFIDINNDQTRDLIVAPNHGVSSQVENTEGVLLYLNMGVDNHPVFELQGKTFLQNTQIEHGDDTAPAFFDYDQDGLLDMLVGNHGYHVDFTDALIPALSLYKNIGSKDSPRFQLIDEDFLGIRASNMYPLLKHMVPVLGDLDNDGDEDLLIGSILGNVYFWENKAASGQPANFELMTENYANIDVGTFAAPELNDLDDDDDLDLLVGGQNGRISYYENKGSSNTPDYQLITEEWGNIQVPDEFGSSFPRSYAKPRLVDYDEDGVVELLVGNVTGYIRIYENVPNTLTDTLEFVGNLFDFDFGSFSAPATAILDSTHKSLYVVGNRRGGLQLFQFSDQISTNVLSNIQESFQLSVFPNPVNTNLNIKWKAAHQFYPIHIEIFNQLGQKVHRITTQQSQISLNVENWSQGIYYVRVSLRGKAVIKKVMVR